jgi:hypothetical protein
LHPELVEYLRNMITPGPAQGIDGVFVHAGSDYDWSQHEDDSVHGIVLEDAEGLGEAYRVLKPGGHLMLVAPEEQPTGHTGACLAEDMGFEVRDAICVPGPGDGDKIHYVPKAARKEREAGLSHLPEKVFGMSGGAQGAIAAAEALAEEEGREMDEADYEAAQTIGLNRVVKRRNIHPTVKPVGIMERLLLSVPTDEGPVVDPFMGSGTTGIACLPTHDFIGIEREEEYLLIAEGRVRHWNVREAAWDTARVTSDLKAYKEAHEAEPETLDLDDLFGL